MRNTCAAFGFDAEMEIEQPSEAEITIRWRQGGKEAVLTANLASCAFSVRAETEGELFRYNQA